jgi:hypothetical protein
MVFWDVMPCGLTLKMEVIYSLKMLVTIHNTTRGHSPQHHTRHIHHPNILKSYIYVIYAKDTARGFDVFSLKMKGRK